ncbi:uncharacterized protein LOC128985793 isoform X2 [Macrosteles quadrilineatus]|nr:uncharacterized protein LOC128985793 isoform X2 [Macrosteles quadrilineatus]
MGWRNQPENAKTYFSKKEKKKSTSNNGQINIAFINDKDLKPSFIQIKRAMGLIIQGIQDKYVSNTFKIIRDDDCRYLFQITDFHNTLLGLMGQEANIESDPESSDDETEKDLIAPRYFEPFEFDGVEEDYKPEDEYETIYHKVRDMDPDFF